MAEQMRRAGRGTAPKVQACLADAERHGEKQEPELPIDFLSPGLDKLQFLKEGRAESLVFDKVSGTEIAHFRINVVLRGGSRGPLAVPMATAMERAYVQGAAPNPPAEALARDNAILSNPGPSAALQKSNAGSLGGIGEAAGRLQDALKGLPR